MIERSLCLWRCDLCPMERYLMVRVLVKVGRGTKVDRLVCCNCWRKAGSPWL